MRRFSLTVLKWHTAGNSTLDLSLNADRLTSATTALLSLVQAEMEASLSRRSYLTLNLLQHRFGVYC